jgi:5-methylcytosine-specific restriction endonuclease McrA
MTNKEPRFGICHHCLSKISYKKLVDLHVESKYGPDHIVLICSPCNDKKTNATVNNTPRKKTRSRVSR